MAKLDDSKNKIAEKPIGRNLVAEPVANIDIDLRRGETGENAKRIAEIEEKNAAMRAYMREVDLFVDGQRAKLHGFKPLLDKREFPEHRIFYTFPLLTEGERSETQKCDVPVVCFGFDSFDLEDGKIKMQAIVEDNKNTHYLNVFSVDQFLIKDLIESFVDYLMECTHEKRVNVQAVTQNVSKLLQEKRVDFNYSSKSVSKYSPYDLNVLPNNSNLKDIDWLKKNFKIGEQVDQGRERLFRAKIGGKEFSFLRSGEMVFLMDNTPTIDVMNAAIKAGHLSEAQKAGFISLEDEMKHKQQTTQQYKEKGEQVGDKKDLRIDWKTAKPTYEYDPIRGLYYLAIKNEPVMDEFEKKYIQLLGTNAARYGGAVLEIGFGMGISGNAVQRELAKHHKLEEGKPACHIIIEFNHEVAEMAREWGKRQKVPVIVLEGDWREKIKEIPEGILTGSLSDPYPLNPDEKHKDAALALSEIYKKLKPGGVSVHYSDSQYCLSPEHERIAREAGFKYIGSITSSFGANLNTGEYYAEGLRMMIPALYKSGGTGSAKWENEKELGADGVKELIEKLFIENPEKFRSLYQLSPYVEGNYAVAA